LVFSTIREENIMNTPMSSGAATLLCAAAALSVPAGASADAAAAFPLAGSWTLVAADQLRADGSRARDYGEAPHGMLFIDNQGRYSLQIYQSERPAFASGDKKNGTAAEYQAASLGASTHFGTIAIDAGAHTLAFHIQSAAFKNWEGSVQQRRYELNGDELSYRVPPRADGSIPISVWRRLK
jgi:hypothetical protein